VTPLNNTYSCHHQIKTMMQNSTSFYLITHYLDHRDIPSLVSLSLTCKNSYQIIKKILNKIQELSKQLYIEFDGPFIKMYRGTDMIKKHGFEQPWPININIKDPPFVFSYYPERSKPDIDCQRYYYKMSQSAIKKTVGFRMSLENISLSKGYDEHCDCYECNWG